MQNQWSIESIEYSLNWANKYGMYEYGQLKISGYLGFTSFTSTKYFKGVSGF